MKTKNQAVAELEEFQLQENIKNFIEFTREFATTKEYIDMINICQKTNAGSVVLSGSGTELVFHGPSSTEALFSVLDAKNECLISLEEVARIWFESGAKWTYFNRHTESGDGGSRVGKVFWDGVTATVDELEHQFQLEHNTDYPKENEEHGRKFYNKFFAASAIIFVLTLTVYFFSP